MIRLKSYFDAQIKIQHTVRKETTPLATYKKNDFKMI